MVQAARADKLPPFDREAEEAVIASALVDPEQVPAIAEIVRPADFFRESNRWCWQAILDVYGRGEGVNQIIVAHELARAGKLEEIGGAACLSRLITELPTSVGAEHYAGLVKRDSTHRKLITVAGQIAKMGYQASADVDGVFSQAVALLESAHAGANMNGARAGTEIMAEWFESPELPNRGVVPPWLRLQRFLPVLRNGKLYVLAGYTSRGKSSMALHLMRETALAGHRVLLESLEMDTEQVRAKLIASEAGVDSKKVERGAAALADDEQRRALEAAARLADAPWWVDDHSRSIGDIEFRAKAHKARHGCDLLIMDHLQEMTTSTPRLNATERTSELCERARGLAADLDVPLLLISQLRRDAERGYRRPELSDLRQSGRIEEAAEAVLLLYDESPRPVSEAHSVDVIVAKNRMGETGTCRMTFWPAWCRFTDE